MSNNDQKNNQASGGDDKKRYAFYRKQRNPSDEVEFIERLKRGDEQAWADFVNEYSPLLYNFLRHKLPTHDVTTDVLNETIMQIVRTIQHFDNRVSLTTFIFSLAQQSVADYWRHPPDEFATYPAALFPDLVAGVPDELQRVLLLRYHNGYSIDEIAQILGRTYKGTESLLQRARHSLRTRMDLGERPVVENKPDLMRPASLYSVLQMLSTQQQKCIDLQMPNEAAIFHRALRFLQRLVGEQPVKETM